MNEGILELVDMLYTLISEARGVPLGNDRCVVERGKALDLLEEIRNRLPAEVAEAQRLVSRREEFISNAKRDGESIRKAAEERARKLVEEQEIVKMAQVQAQQIVADAENKAKEARRVVTEYVDNTLANTEQTVGQTLEMVRSTRARFRSAAGTQPSARNKAFDDILD